MRTLKYRKSYRVTQTSIHKGESLNTPEPCYYERFLVLETKYGLVTAVDFDWQTNTGKIFMTDFATIINGIKYSATLDEGKLSDRQLKWLATHFAKTIHEKIKSNSNE